MSSVENGIWCNVSVKLILVVVILLNIIILLNEKLQDFQQNSFVSLQVKQVFLVLEFN